MFAYCGYKKINIMVETAFAGDLDVLRKYYFVRSQICFHVFLKKRVNRFLGQIEHIIYGQDRLQKIMFLLPNVVRRCVRQIRSRSSLVFVRVSAN